MTETATTVIHEADWSGFEQEPSPNNVIRIDLHRTVPQPDWLTMTDIFKEEETAALREADESPIYDYEIERQRPVPPLETVSERVNWRQRTKRFMGKASEALRDIPVSALATVQAKTEEFYGDEGAGTKRKKASVAVAGALVLGATTYLGSKGLVSSGSSPIRGAEEAVGAITTVAANHLDFTALQHVIHEAPQHHEHVRQATEVTLHSGNNPWTVTESQLHAQGVAHPSDTRAAADDARFLKLNHISPLQALKLHVGYKLKLLKNW